MSNVQIWGPLNTHVTSKLWPRDFEHNKHFKCNNHRRIHTLELTSVNTWLGMECLSGSAVFCKQGNWNGAFGTIWPFEETERLHSVEFRILEGFFSILRWFLALFAILWRLLAMISTQSQSQIPWDWTLASPHSRPDHQSHVLFINPRQLHFFRHNVQCLLPWNWPQGSGERTLTALRVVHTFIELELRYWSLFEDSGECEGLLCRHSWIDRSRSGYPCSRIATCLSCSEDSGPDV